MAALGVLLAPAVARATAPTFVQGATFTTGSRVLTTTVTLTSPVAGGDLLVGWFSQYDVPGQVQVSDNVNGAWTRAPESLHFLNDAGVIALYYRENSQAAPSGMTITVSAADAWYAVCAVFHPVPSTPPVPPSTPAGLHATSVASTRAALSWSPSSGSVAGYTVYRKGSAIATTGPDTTTFLDPNVTRATTYGYAVDAFDLANDHSARSASLTVSTPAASPEFVQGTAASPADRLASYTYTLSEPVLGGDLLVGWFGQYNAPGQVQVSDNINGPWTQSVSLPINGPWARSDSTTFSGTGDIALF